MAKNEINQRRRVIDGEKFRLLGIMGCKPCTAKWKRSLQGHKRNVRIIKIKKGYEVWTAWQK